MATIAELEKIHPTGKALCDQIAQLQGTREQVLLSFSLGKDALCAWLEIRQHFDRVIPFYLYGLPDLQFINDSLDYYENVLGEHIIRVPAPAFYAQLREKMFQPPERIELINACQFPRFGYADIRRVICEDLQLPDSLYYATGVRAPDSPMRMTAISKYGPITHSKQKFHPVWHWKKDKLIHELKRHNIKLPVDYLMFSRTMDGKDLRFTWPLKKHYPDDFRRLLEWFPLAEVEFSRYEFAQRRTLMQSLTEQGASPEQIDQAIIEHKQQFTYEEHP